jgi:putative FmdB family regulatory protein
MPTYEYVCAKCGHEFEKIQPMAERALTTCPKEICGQKKWGRGPVKRKMSGGAGLIFKGSGFYITDYRSEGYKQAAKMESESAKPATSGDSKTAGKSETKSTKPAAPKKD